MTQKEDQVWFITGANKGLGAAIAKEALDRGYKVVATARNPKSAGEILGNFPNLLIVKLDITDDEQVQSAVRAALGRFGRIDVLVNNAGYALLGFFEETSEKLIRQEIETNVFGTMKSDSRRAAVHAQAGFRSSNRYQFRVRNQGCWRLIHVQRLQIRTGRLDRRPEH